MSSPRWVLHVDMDAFFAAVEVLDEPTLAGRPVIVGGTGRRGVVASASYEARAHGVRSAMPTAQARRLCPHATFLHGRHDRYAEVSEQLMAVFASVTPLVEPLSLDEAFLDVTGALHGEPVADLGHRVRDEVQARLGLACSVGAGPTKLVAKLASARAKPVATPTGPRPGPGVLVVEEGDVLAFLEPLAVESLWGVGPATLERLHRLGVLTVGDLARAEPAALVASLGEAAGTHLAALARGQDPRPVVADRRARSVGQEETFASDRFGEAELLPVLGAQCDAVAARLRAQGVGARTVSIKVRFADFRTITRSTTVASPTDRAVDLRRAAAGLLAGVEPGLGVRLLGVSASGLVAGAPRQLTLDEVGDPQGQAERVVDEIRARWGDGAIAPGRTALQGGRRPAPWGPAEPS